MSHNISLQENPLASLGNDRHSSHKSVHCSALCENLFYQRKRQIDGGKERPDGLGILVSRRIPVDDEGEIGPAAADEHPAREGEESKLDIVLLLQRNRLHFYLITASKNSRRIHVERQAAVA